MNRSKILAAVEEAMWVFGIAFTFSFASWVQGWGALPDVSASVAALKAAFVAGCVAAAKGVVWALTTRTQ